MYCVEQLPSDSVPLPSYQDHYIFAAPDALHAVAGFLEELTDSCQCRAGRVLQHPTLILTLCHVTKEDLGDSVEHQFEY